MPTNLESSKRLQQAEAALKRQNECLHELARSPVLDAGELSEAFRKITEVAAHGLDIERVGVWLYEDDTKDAMSSPDLYLRSSNEHTTAPVLSHTAFPEYFAELAKERVIPAGDALQHPATAGLRDAYLVPLGIGAVLDAPIRFGGRMVGLVCHEHVGPARAWTQEEINFAGAMADAVARAMAAAERVKAVRALQDANRSLEERIRERTQELANSNEELRALHRHKDEMFQNVSHELRTPLTLILTPAERLLDEEELSSGARAKVELIRKNSLRLLGLVNDLLDLAKLESSTLSVSSEPVDVASIASALVSDVRAIAIDRGLDIRYEGPTSPVWMSGDPKHFERVLINLVSNALKFTPAPGEVTVGVIDRRDTVEVFVADTGPGIPESARARIFERFQQADRSTTRRHGGTGIGLALVDELTRLMAGTVSLDSQDGRGSTFSLSFPRVAPPSPHSHVEDAPLDGEALEKRARYAGLAGQQEPSTTQRGTRGPLVVVAEDDADLRTQLIELLQSHYRVLAFDNGRSAYDAVLEHRPHLVLADVMMPEMDGLELARMLRGRPELRDTPLVLLTARSAVEHRIEGRQEAIDAYLTKPFHPKELLATLDGLLRSRMRLLGSYLVLEKLGGGGQGEVFRGEHLESRERVAIKVMPSASASTDTERAALLELRHPNIVRILEEGASGNRCYLAVEYLEGQSLSELIGLQGTLSPSQVGHILLALANALACVHESGLIHGDVKPSNVMVLCGRTDLRGRVRLIDFGAAHH